MKTRTRLSPTAAASALIVACGALTLPTTTAAHADSDKTSNLIGAGQGMEYLWVNNGARTITAVATFAKPIGNVMELRLGLDTGFFDPNLQVGTGNPFPEATQGFEAAYHVDTGTTRLTRVSNNKVGVVACAGAKTVRLPAKKQVKMTIPQSCLGADSGMFRPQLHVAYLDTDQQDITTLRVLQKGKRGAAYFDVDGNGRGDRPSGGDTIRQRLVSPTKYAVRVSLGNNKFVRATAPRADYVDWPTRRHPVFSSLDIDRNGKADIIGNPYDHAGDGFRLHLFTMVGNQLKLVRGQDGKPFDLATSFVGRRGYSDFRCGNGRLQTWDTVRTWPKDPMTKPITYRLKVTTWSFATGTAIATTTEDKFVPSWSVHAGNWSHGSCLAK